MRTCISLLSDFGASDSFVGQMKGVVLNINPEVNIVDISHDIRPFGIREAAIMMEKCYSYFPLGTVHVAIVDPGVGSERRPIIVSNGDYFFVGPDNGLFSLVMAKSEKTEVIHITNDEFFLKKGSMTFQGRDVFAPVAAWLSKGEPASRFGRVIKNCHVLDIPVPASDQDGVHGEVMYVDRFGNAITNISLECVESSLLAGPISSLIVKINNVLVPLKSHYEQGEGAGLCALINSDGIIELFVYQGSASKINRIVEGAAVSVLIP